ncbi:hypothetical protein DAPPUDRAFT_251804 [Daphnia pulex]|uniref:acid phosphatase n=1 Tax=Daphnia pulex TaxID=6669 RepID=E9H158_DAPPU|nr:hypothetical protein DAPPUDRAFT_251804 [Daphnia pulex]|eukprot:EFX74583.1 hypothetical protein DAPPUDRAFT_251804 [Daphnia pulex]
MDWSTLALSFALFLSVSGETECLGKASNTLRLVHMLYRHGDRTPVRPYPLDPYLNLTHWPVSWGQLTKEGKERHFKLGQLNRERYGDFLSETYNPDEIYVRSTDVDRTLMNLLLVLESECPRYDELLAQLNSSPDVRKRMDSNKEMLDYLAVKSGLNMSEIDDIEYLYDTLFIEDRFNKTLPEWTTKYFPSPMKEFSDFSFEMKAYNLEMQRLRGVATPKGMTLVVIFLTRRCLSFISSSVVEHLGAYAQSKLTPPNRKLFMYSAHDVTVATFLSALNIFNGIQPPYASMVLVELHEPKPNDFYVKILYKNVSDDGRNPEVLSLPGCTRFCPLDKFFQLVQNATSDDIKVECKLVKPDVSTFDNMLACWLVIELPVAGCLLLVALLVIGALWFRELNQIIPIRTLKIKQACPRYSQYLVD